MPDMLDQAEVDALLHLVNAEAPGASPASPSSRLPPEGSGGYRVAAPSEIHLYDFKRPERVSKDQVTSLENLHEVFARNVSASLSSFLRTVVEVRLISVEQFVYSEFTLSLPSPTSINLLSCAPLEGNMILEINPSIIFPIIDRLLGGGRAEPYLLDRPFTAIEQGLVGTILARILDQLTQTWENVRPIRFEVVESESNPFLMQVVAPNEPIVLLSFEVIMGEHSGMINLCIPFVVIEPIMPEFSSSNAWFVPRGSRDGGGSRGHLLENIAAAEVEVAAVLAEVPLKLQDFLTMRPGDLLDTGKPVGAPLVLYVEKERKFLGQPGTSRGRIALAITGLAAEEPTPPPAEPTA